ncbi:hypothetical protein N0V95_008191, partial [Ascochyta clinopodiicola]
YGPAALLTIRVGKEPHHKDFVAHESFLTCRSEFFRRAVNGRWEEAETRVIKLPEDSPEVFATYLDCAYTNQVPSELLDRPSTASINWHEAVKLSHVDITNLILLYTTADKLLDPFTKDAVIRVFFKVIHYEGADGQKTGPNHPHISLAYENTPEHSPIRRLIVDRALVYRFGAAALLTVSVGTGSAQQEFVAHESFLTSRSEFFRRAMNGAWEESESRVVKLPEDDPHTFELYMSFVYTGQVPVNDQLEDLPEEVDKSELRKIIKEEYDNFFRLYILADKLQDSVAKDAAIAAIFKVRTSGIHNGLYCMPKYKTLSMIYEQLPAGSPAKRLAVDIASKCGIKDMGEHGQQLPSEYLKDLVVLLRHRAQQGYNKKNEADRKGVAAYMDQTIEVSYGSDGLGSIVA